MKYKVKEPFLLRDDPKIPGKGKRVKPGDMIEITQERVSAVRDLEGEGYIVKVPAKTTKKK